MHGRNRTLAVALSAWLLIGCTSAPPRADGPNARSPSPQGIFLAKLVAVVAAIGGNNPNPAYRAINASCTSDPRALTASRASGDEALTPGPVPTTVSTSCQRVVAAK